jgi:hypothetical protein
MNLAQGWGAFPMAPPMKDRAYIAHCNAGLARIHLASALETELKVSLTVDEISELISIEANIGDASVEGPGVIKRFLASLEVAGRARWGMSLRRRSVAQPPRSRDYRVIPLARDRGVASRLRHRSRSQ